MKLRKILMSAALVCSATGHIYAAHTQGTTIQTNDTVKADQDSLMMKGMLSDIVVKGHRPLIRREEDKTVFEVSRMKNLGAMKGMDVLRYAPSVMVDEVNGTVKVGSSAATVYVNDRKLSSDEVESYLKGLNASDISRIEVQRNRGADKSADIQGGIIYIYTRQRLGLMGDVGLYTAAPFSKATYEWNPSTHLYFGTQKWNIYGSYYYDQARRRQDAYTENEFLTEGTTHVSDGFLNMFSGRHSYKVGSVWTIVPRHVVSVEFNGAARGRNHTDSYLQENYTDAGKKVYRGIAGAYDHTDGHSYNVAASYNWKMDDKGSFLKALFNYNKVFNAPYTHLTAAYDTYPVLNMDEENIPEADSRNLTGNLDFKKKFAKGWGMAMGGEYAATKRASDLNIVDNLAASDKASFSHYDYRENIAGAYAGVTKDIGGKVFVNASLRMENTDLNGKSSDVKEHVNRNYTDWFPYFFISHTVSDRFSYDLTYTRSVVRPSFSQLNNLKSRLTEVMYSQGNADLQRVLTDKVALAFNFLQAHSVTVSYSRTPDAMTQVFDVDNGNVTYMTANWGTTEQAIFSYAYSGKVLPWWQLNAQTDVFYTYLPKSYDTTHLWSGDLSVRNRFTFKNIGTFSLNFVSWLPTIDGNSYMHGQWSLSTSYSRSFFNDRLSLYCGVFNIFDTRRDWAHSLNPVLSYYFRGKWTTRQAYVSLTWNFSSRKKVSNRQLENNNSIQNRM